ncbi:hypothetical protein D3C81_2211710 [compost metagenome]
MVICLQLIDHPLNPGAVCAGLEGMAFEMLVVIDIIDGIGIDLALAGTVVIVHSECGQRTGIQTPGEQ